MKEKFWNFQKLSPPSSCTFYLLQLMSSLDLFAIQQRICIRRRIRRIRIISAIDMSVTVGRSSGILCCWLWLQCSVDRREVDRLVGQVPEASWPWMPAPRAAAGEARWLLTIVLTIVLTIDYSTGADYSADYWLGGATCCCRQLVVAAMDVATQTPTPTTPSTTAIFFHKTKINVVQNSPLSRNGIISPTPYFPSGGSPPHAPQPMHPPAGWPWI